MSIRTASFQATYTAAVGTTTGTIADEDAYRVRVIHSATPQFGFYSWNFTTIATTGVTSILNEIGTGSITGMQISLGYNNNSDGLGFEFSKYIGVDPDGATGSTMLDAATRFEVSRFDIETNGRSNLTIDLFDYNLFYDVHLEIAARNHISFVIRRRGEFDSSNGSIELGGKTLLSSLGDWRAIIGNEVSAPPLLIIQYEIPEEPSPLLSMKYTTSDPTTSQNTPENSIGGHPSPNDVYPFGDIRESISSVQSTIPIDLESTLPTKTGLASVGPEVFKYTLIDTVNHQLGGITRGIAPASFPAGFDSFGIAERVQYLHTDTDNVHKLFDTRSASGLIQYRCIAIVNDDSEHDFNIQNSVIGIVQDPNANVQIHIGIEVPKHDSFLGVAESGTTDMPGLLVDSALNAAAGFETGFFNGSFITFPTLGLSRVITSFDDGSFQFAATTGLGSGVSYVIKPAPCQTISNDATSPTTNSGRFGGFSETGAGVSVTLLDHTTTMQECDAFYVWIRRTLTFNVKNSDDIGAVLLFRYRDT